MDGGTLSKSSEKFKLIMLSLGMQPPEVLKPNTLHRFPGIGKGPKNRAGWCWLAPNEQGGAFGCWASGLSETWREGTRNLTRNERAALYRAITEAKHQAELKQAEAWQQAAARARRIWSKAKHANSDHPYLKNKLVRPFCARQSGPHLILPICGCDGRLSSLQFIGPDGAKLMLKGGRKRGRFIPVHGQRGTGRIVIAEGFATAATLAEAEPYALTVAALDAGNLKPVAVAARSNWPSAELIIAGDDDRLRPANPGATKAREAAIAADALLALPEWPADAPEHLTDFNDLAQWLAGGAS